jgi:hypothetical protein
MFYEQGVDVIIQVGFGGKNTPMLVEVVDGHNLSLGTFTHETKSLDVTIGSHISKVVFNVISSPKNLVIIGLFWFVLHNP